MFRLSKAESSVILLVLTLFISVVAIADQSRRASEDVIERAFANAQDLVDFVVVASQHYIESISPLDVNDLTAYPEEQADSVWLPTTFATRYTRSYSDQNPEVDFRIYSSDPFRLNRDRVLDDFGRNALPELYNDGILDNANRITESVEQQEFIANGETFSITISAGVAFLSENENAQDLLKRADELLYNAKNTGRNNISDSLLLRPARA